MEEILASIRKIISEDQAEPAQAAVSPQPRPAPVAAVAAVEPDAEDEEPEAVEEIDILDLTHEVHEEPSEAESAPAAYAAESEAGEPVIEAASEPVQDEAADEGFISSNTRQAMSRAFQPLEQQAAPANEVSPALTAIDGSRLEAIFTQAIQGSVQPAVQDWVAKNSGNMVQHMKPIIREWMDQKLPPLIEKAVKAEIAAAVRSLMQRR
jgi:cell pole-organizing protein PopZ